MEYGTNSTRRVCWSLLLLGSTRGPAPCIRPSSNDHLLANGAVLTLPPPIPVQRSPGFTRPTTRRGAECAPPTVKPLYPQTYFRLAASGLRGKAAVLAISIQVISRLPAKRPAFETLHALGDHAEVLFEQKVLEDKLPLALG